MKQVGRKCSCRPGLLMFQVGSSSRAGRWAQFEVGLLFPLFQVQCSWMGWCGGRVGTICGAWCGINARTAPCSAALNPNPLLTDCCLVAIIFLARKRIISVNTVLIMM